jgi:hypothetical protein
MNPYRYQVAEYCAEWPYGINNRIVASAATLKGCMSEYKRHLLAFSIGKIEHTPLKTVFLCDGVPFDVQTIKEKNYDKE